MKNLLNLTKKSYPNLVLYILVLIIIVLFGLLIWSGSNKNKTPESIDSFHECADAGYPIMESYPEQCSVPGGQSFVNPAQLDDGVLVHPIAPAE